MNGERCSAKLHGTGLLSFRACSRRATIERDGKAYCGQHDPDRVKARREESTARWQAESAEKMRGWKRDELARDLAALAVKDPSAFPPNAQPIIEQLLNLAATPATPREPMNTQPEN